MHDEVHRSRTCFVLLAEDRRPAEDDVAQWNSAVNVAEKDGTRATATSLTVAMKFMRDREQFDREVNTRNDCQLDPKHLLSLALFST